MGRYKTCGICGNTFEATHNAQKYCSNECSLESLKRMQQQWYAKNADRVKKKQREYNKQYRATHREQTLEYAKQYRQTLRCKEIKRRSEHKRRAQRAKTNVGNWTSSEVFERDKGICQICKLPVCDVEDAPKRLRAQYDHIIPLSKGGDDVLDNVQLTHMFCNEHKGAKYMSEIDMERCRNIISKELEEYYGEIR